MKSLNGPRGRMTARNSRCAGRPRSRALLVALSALLAFPLLGSPAKAETGVDTWTPKALLGPPPARSHASMAYDAARQRIVLFGGSSPPIDGKSPLKGDTWTWDGQTQSWTRQNPNPSTTPPAQQGASMAYDAARQRVVLIGNDSVSNVPKTGTWTWDGKDWTKETPTNVPPPRANAAMAYDPVRQRIVLFGGAQGFNNIGAPLGDTWTWNGADWTEQITPVGGVAPLARSASSMAYDPVSGGVLLFSGRHLASKSQPLMADTWLWNGSTWAKRNPVTSPTPRAYASMAYDAASNRIVLFGGADGSVGAAIAPSAPGTYYYDPYNESNPDTVTLNDTWAWDGQTWARQVPPLSPSPRKAAAMAYDDKAQKLLLFGGSPVNNNEDTYPLKNTDHNLGDTWTFGTEPGALAAPQIPSGLPFISATAPDAPANLRADASNATVDLSWKAPSYDGGAAKTGYQIYRGTSSGSETLLATVRFYQTNYRDSTAANATQYFYQVTAVNSAGESPKSNEASATPTGPPAAAAANLSITNTVGRQVATAGTNVASLATAGQDLTYTLTTTNQGPDTAVGVTLTDSFTLPQGVTYKSATPSQGTCAFVAPTLTCALGSVNKDAQAIVTLVVTPTQAGPVSNTASVTSTTQDPDTSNNSASATTVVAPPANSLITINDTAVDEGNLGTTDAVLTVSLNQPNAAPTSFNYSTANGTATAADNDFNVTGGVLSFVDGEASKTISIPVVGDTKFETDEVFSVILANPPASTTILRNRGQATIQNDDPAPVPDQASPVLSLLGTLLNSIRSALGSFSPF